MATGGEVLAMLCPDTEWVIYGDDFESINWIKGEPITKAQFTAGFAKYDAWKAEQEAAQAKLADLAWTTDDLKSLGLWNT